MKPRHTFISEVFSKLIHPIKTTNYQSFKILFLLTLVQYVRKSRYAKHNNKRINNDFQLRVNVHKGILLLPHMGNLRCFVCQYVRLLLKGSVHQLFSVAYRSMASLSDSALSSRQTQDIENNFTSAKQQFSPLIKIRHPPFCRKLKSF